MFKNATEMRLVGRIEFRSRRDKFKKRTGKCDVCIVEFVYLESRLYWRHIQGVKDIKKLGRGIGKQEKCDRIRKVIQKEGKEQL